MPRKYEHMRDKFIAEGMSAKAAKGKAARIYNSQRKRGQAPVTRSVTRSEHPILTEIKKGQR